MRRVGHVFRVSYEAVDRELPALLAREKPDALIMFGLAARTRHLRIETRARNAAHASTARCWWTDTCHRHHRGGGAGDAAVAGSGATAAHGGAAAGVPAALSHDAGRYLCNYLCWRAAEAADSGGPRLTAFIHVPSVRRSPMLTHRTGRRSRSMI